MKAKKDSRHTKHTLGVMMILFSAAVLITALIWTTIESPSAPPNQTVLLIDVTDPLSALERTSLTNKISTLISNSAKTTFSVYEIVDDPASPPSAVTKQTAPLKTVANVNPLEERRDDIEKEWQSFTSSLMQGIDQATRGKPSQRSPIFESVQWVSLKELNAPQAVSVPRQLIIVSDLRQHTGEFSFYNNIPDFASLVSNPDYVKLKSNLAGVEIQLWVLRNHTTNATQLADLWRHILHDQGGHIALIDSIP